MTKADQLVQWAEHALGSAYVFGATGQRCTPDYRSSVADRLPAYADAIKCNCPVLAGKQSACTGCKYDGRRCYDCRGLTREAVRAVTGRPVMGAGATSQWKDASNWARTGAISTLPDRPCLLFVKKGGSMSHTGVYVGGGYCIHASGHSAGVIKSKMPRSWTHWAIPVGLYEEGGTGVGYVNLRFGDKGMAVVDMQKRLMTLGYRLPRYGADGDFGSETLKALNAFQMDAGLPVTDQCDKPCWEALFGEVPADAPDEDEPDPDGRERIVALLTEAIELIRAM
jgi:hypothetical protein